MPPPGYKPWSRDALRQRRSEWRQHAPAPLVGVALAMGIGVAVDRYVASLGLGWLAIGAAALGCWWLIRRRPVASSVVLLAAIMAAAGFWRHAGWRLFDQHEIGRYAQLQSHPVCFEGVARRSPSRRAAATPSPFRAIPQGEGSELELDVVALRNGERWQAATGRCDLLVDGHLLGVRAGDRVRVFGQFRQPSPAMNPGEFDYRQEARADRVLTLARAESPDCVSVVSRSGGWQARGIDSVRTRTERALYRQMPSDQAAIAAAMLLGERGALGREVTDQFKRTGAMHVLVVSGLHLSAVAAMLLLAAQVGLAPRRQSIIAVMILIGLYVLLTGARPPVLRAAVLAEIACVAILRGRRPLAFNSLAAAAVVVLALNPADLFRSGPQLSFMAVAVLIWFGQRELERRSTDPLDRLLEESRPLPIRGAHRLGHWAWITMSATAAVWIVAAPLVAREYHLITPVAIAASVPVFGSVIGAVSIGMLMATVGWALPPLEPLLAAGCRWMIGLLQMTIETADRTPGGWFWTPGPAVWWLLGFYALLALALWRKSDARWRRGLLMAGVAWIALGFGASAWRHSENDTMRCAFLAVGHGSCTVVETPDGATLLYDAGALGSPDRVAETIAGYLWSRGVSRIDGVVLSHPDLDHYNALPGLLERFEVRAVYASRLMFPRTVAKDDRSGPAELWRVLERHHVPVHTLELGDRLRLGGADAEVIHPNLDIGLAAADNANSVVLGLQFAGRRLLLPGDLESPGLDTVIAQEPYDTDLLLAPHHGSRHSDPPGFAAWSTPEWVVVSGGVGDDLGEVRQGYEASGARVVATAERGAVVAELRASGVEIRSVR